MWLGTKKKENMQKSEKLKMQREKSESTVAENVVTPPPTQAKTKTKRVRLSKAEKEAGMTLAQKNKN